MSLVEVLSARAFARAAPPEANAAIDRVRVERGTPEAPALSYEVALPALDPDAFLLQRALPKLVYFLHCRGLAPAPTPGIFLSLFTSTGLLFLDAGETAAFLGQQRGLTPAELVRRYGADGVGDPKALGT